MYVITSGALPLLYSQDLKFLNNFWEDIEYFKRPHGILIVAERLEVL